MRYGTIAIIGRTNVGKSTFLNQVLGMPLAIVSRQPQTTRDTLLGVVNSGDAQIAFVDTPGLHRPKNELGRRMNQEATDSLHGADGAVFMTDIFQIGGEEKAAKNPGLAPKTRPGDRNDAELLELMPKDLPTLLVVNKIDRLRDKGRLLPYLQTMNDRHPFVATVPISALAGDGTDRVLAEVVKFLPEGERHYPEDEVTNRPVSFFAREYIREQVLVTFAREVPHAVAITLDSIEERTTGFHIAATIHVEKPGQRAILVGHGGEKVKEVGIQARQRIAALTEQPVHLKLFVRVTERWRNMPRQLAELGYTLNDS
jgi:GTP-binding protein Era